jgi:hypothetical protein
MVRRVLGGIWAVALALAAVSVSAVWAAPAPQEGELTATPDSTATDTPRPFFGPTSTPTATLLPPPSGGGRVAVGTLAVRAGPSSDWPAIGGLAYGTEVYPRGRSANGNWIVIDWEWAGSIGWILARLVEWDPALDLQALPVFLPPFTSTPLSTVATPQPEGTGELTATSVLPTITATPILLPQPSSTPAPTMTDTPEPAVVALPPATSAPSSITAPTLPRISLPRLQPPGPIFWAGSAVFALAIYGLIWIQGWRETHRYSRGFPIKTCPVCQSGRLYLEEHIERPAGIPRMRRSVRCDLCRSVLRQIRPGLWRYTIDPFVNPELAKRYNSRQFTDADLLAFSEEAEEFEPYREAPVTSPPEAEDILKRFAELEARLLAESSLESGLDVQPADMTGQSLVNSSNDESEERTAPSDQPGSEDEEEAP